MTRVCCEKINYPIYYCHFLYSNHRDIKKSPIHSHFFISIFRKSSCPLLDAVPCTAAAASCPEAPVPSVLATIGVFLNPNPALGLEPPPWPTGLYAIDVFNVIQRVESDNGLKKRFPLKQDVVNHVVGRHVPLTSYRRQRSSWSRASEDTRKRFLGARRSVDGLWSKFPKVRS